MKQILRYLKPYLGKLLAATVLIALSTLCDLLLPTWMSAILNGGIAARDFPAIAVRCLQMLAIAAVSLASILGGTRLSTEVVACFCADLRADVFRKVNTLSFEEFGSLGTAALVTRATHDVDTVSWVASMLSGTVATIPMLFLGGVKLRWFALGLGVVGVFVAVYLATKGYAGDRIQAWLHPFEDESDSGYQIVQSLYAIGSGGLMGLGLGRSRQ